MRCHAENGRRFPSRRTRFVGKLLERSNWSAGCMFSRVTFLIEADSKASFTVVDDAAESVSVFLISLR